MRVHEFIVEDTQNESNAWRTLQAKLSQLRDGFARMSAFLRPLGGGKLQSVSSPVVYGNERIIALPIINGVKVPFYISTGEGGKENVATGKWYPFFGISSSGWLNKGSEKDINAYYGSAALAKTANYLDTVLGDLQPYIDNYISGNVMPVCMFKKELSQISVDMNPADRKDVDAVEANIDDVLRRIGSQPFYNKSASTKSTKPQSSQPILSLRPTPQPTNTTPVSGPITVVSGNKPRTFNLSLSLNRRSFDSGYSDAQFWDATNQVSLQKQPDNTWLVVPNQSATNATVINGRVVTTPVRAHSGMTITVGRRDGSNQKTPVTIK